MKREDILRVFKMLANSQGFYGRLLNMIESDKEWGDEMLSHLESLDLKSDLDVVLAVECGM